MREANQLGIKNIWVKLGSSSQDTVKLCEANFMSMQKEEFMLTNAEPAGLADKFHHSFRKLSGKLPKRIQESHKC